MVAEVKETKLEKPSVYCIIVELGPLTPDCVHSIFISTAFRRIEQESRMVEYLL